MNEFSIPTLKKLLTIQGKTCDDLGTAMIAALANDHPDYPEMKKAWLTAINVRRAQENELIERLTPRNYGAEMAGYQQIMERATT